MRQHQQQQMANGTAPAPLPPLGMFPTQEPMLRNLRIDSSASAARARSSVTRGPGLYTVVKCGASGHNVRSNPNLMAAPIGMLNLGDVVNIVEVKELEGSARTRGGGGGGGNGEVWVQLDQV